MNICSMFFTLLSYASFLCFYKASIVGDFFFNFNSLYPSHSCLYLWFCDQFFQRIFFFEINFWSPTLVSSTSMHIQQFPLQFVTLFSCIILNMVTLVKFLKLPSHQMWFFLILNLILCHATQNENKIVECVNAIKMVATMVNGFIDCTMHMQKLFVPVLTQFSHTIEPFSFAQHFFYFFVMTGVFFWSKACL